jgi:hypothetical protein
MDINVFQGELLRLQIFWVATSLITFMITMWVLCLVVKAAVRDGINESAMVDTWKSRVAAKLTKDASDTSARDER